jgi:isopentenyl diphosphate isomerase/L-lactate dehydrogenase-like FMN-dependent dehydrogenase
VEQVRRGNQLEVDISDQWARSISRAHSIADLRELARRRLPRAVFDYIDGAADQELTSQRNVRAFDDIALVPRMLTATPECDTSTELLGEHLALPVLITPTGFSGIVWPRGEAAVARAAAAAGTVMVVSAASSLSLEAIAAASKGTKWFQLFIYKDREVTLDLARRAMAAGYQALVVTVDVQAPGNRYRDIRNGFTVPPRLRLSNSLDTLTKLSWARQMASQPRVTFPNFEAYGRSGLLSIAEWLNGLIDPSVQWSDLEWLRAHWAGPLIVKGIMHPDDARRALDAGVDVVMVSNHGGRQMDTEPATVEVLPLIVDAVDDRAPVIIDSGIRRGTDVLKCIALGARACLIGRSYLWGLGAAGEAGVSHALSILKDELKRALAHGGWNRVRDLRRDALIQRNPLPWPENSR